MKAYFLKKTRPILYSFSCFHKDLLGGSFKYLFGFKEINACKLKKICSENSAIKAMVDFANTTVLKGTIQKECPYGPGFIQVNNASYPRNSIMALSKIQIYPNGIYRLEARAFNRDDDNILSLNLTVVNKWRENTVAGYEKF